MLSDAKARTAAIALALAVLMAGSGGVTGTAHAVEDGCDAQCVADLAAARAATEHYGDWTAALRDGFVETGDCTSSPGGTVAIQWAHPQRIFDQNISVEQPESLLYVRQGNLGVGKRLLGLEYSVPADGDRPELFGRSFSGPEPARVPGLPDQYVLRVWLYSDNPDGVFADVNPAEACGRDELVDWHGLGEDCLEVAGVLSVPEEGVRRHVPSPYELQPSMKPGHVQVNVGTHHCARYVTSDGTTLKEPLLFGYYTALLQAFDYVGPDFLDSRYLLRFFLDDDASAEWLRRGMDVGPELVSYAQDVRREFAPVAGIGDPAYRFVTPDFVLDAVVFEPLSPPMLDATVRFIHDTDRGRSAIRVWARAGDLPINRAVVTVTPMPGSLLADMVGCAPESTSCDPITADSVLVTKLDTAIRLTTT